MTPSRSEMMTTGSTLPRRILARLLRDARTDAGIAVDTARKAIGVSGQTFWRMETGQPTRINPLFIRHLAELYKVSEETTDVLLALTEESQGKGWWHAYSDELPKHFDFYVGLEDAAKRFSSYSTLLLPGLLQTADYRREVIWTEFPSMPTDEVERRIELSQRRQQRLRDKTNPLTVCALIDECALRRLIGSREVMAAQLHHLVEIGSLPNVSVRVVPMQVGRHSGTIAGPFVLLEFPRHPTAKLTEPPVVYIQGFTGALYLEKPDEVRQYRNAYAEIQRAALDDGDSQNLIRMLMKELRE